MSDEIQPDDEHVRSAIRNLSDATILIVRLCRRLPADDPVREKALDWMHRRGLTPSVLRLDSPVAARVEIDRLRQRGRKLVDERVLLHDALSELGAPHSDENGDGIPLVGRIAWLGEQLTAARSGEAWQADLRWAVGELRALVTTDASGQCWSRGSLVNGLGPQLDRIERSLAALAPAAAADGQTGEE